MCTIETVYATPCIWLWEFCVAITYGSVYSVLFEYMKLYRLSLALQKGGTQAGNIAYSAKWMATDKGTITIVTGVEAGPKYSRRSCSSNSTTNDMGKVQAQVLCIYTWIASTLLLLNSLGFESRAVDRLRLHLSMDPRGNRLKGWCDTANSVKYRLSASLTMEIELKRWTGCWIKDLACAWD